MAAPHIVTKHPPGQPVRYYCYAWRGGPLVYKREGGKKPTLAEIMDMVVKARQDRGLNSVDQGAMRGLIVAYRASPEYQRLSATTRASWSIWLDRIEDKFGRARLGAIDDRRIRGDILEWRDKWAGQPRIVFTGVGRSISRTWAPALRKATAAFSIAVTASACSSSRCGV